MIEMFACVNGCSLWCGPPHVAFPSPWRSTRFHLRVTFAPPIALLWILGLFCVMAKCVSRSGCLGAGGGIVFVVVYENSASDKSKTRAGAKLKLQTLSVKLDFKHESSTFIRVENTIFQIAKMELDFTTQLFTLTKIVDTISPRCERGALLQHQKC